MGMPRLVSWNGTRCVIRVRNASLRVSVLLFLHLDARHATDTTSYATERPEYVCGYIRP